VRASQKPTCNSQVRGYPRSPRQTLHELAEFASPEATHDRYGKGELIASFEQQIAELRGTTMPSMPCALSLPHAVWSCWTVRRIDRGDYEPPSASVQASGMQCTSLPDYIGIVHHQCS
jgi:hypothetical protein